MNDVSADQTIIQGSTEVEQYHDHHRSSDRNQEKGQFDSQDLDAGQHGSPDQDRDTTLVHTVTSHWTEEDEASILPTRWWYAQTAFPLCAGTFGPMANAFSICPLVENWRIEIPVDGKEVDGRGIKDPKWLITVNAISLACALIANMSLLLNMARRLSFSVAQSITIIGFWVSSMLLIGLIARASHDFREPGVANQALTQAYYYACWAAGLYQIISYLMCVTVYGALRGKYDRDFKLTTAQRTLMLQTISFLAYLLIGALIFSHVEGWEYLDAVYWADFTLLTVGIGDYAPATHTGRSLLFPFAIGGIVVLGLVVSSIRSLILDRGKAKHSARMTEKIRRKVVKEINHFRKGESSFHRRRPGVSPEIAKQIATGPRNSADDEFNRRKAEFGAMRKVQDFSERRQKWMNLFVSTSAWAMLWFFGALIFAYTERNEQNWSYFVSVYFAYTSLLTIGYGDLSPTSDSGKAFFVFWSLLAVPSLTIVISDMSDTVVRFIKDATIWLGEVTILPSSEGTIRESLERGLSKATSRLSRKLFTSNQNDQKPLGSTGKNDESTRKLHHLYETSRKRMPRSNNDETDRVARDFEALEEAEENSAHNRNEPMAEDQHRYRRLLVSQIRKLYADSHQSTPKKYTYDEWAYFLTLLGQDERSSEFHRLAPLKQSTASGLAKQWSWIGPRSPLMSNKHESALLLEMFFERLEESLTDLNNRNAVDDDGR